MNYSKIDIPATGLTYMEKENHKSTIEVIFEKIKDYLETRVELIKLKAIDKSSSLVSMVIAFIAVFIIFVFVFIFFNIGIALLISDLIGKSYAGFLILALLYTVVGIIILKNKNKWIKTPLINMMVKGLHE